MNRQLKKNSSKRIASIIGIASISALFSLPILAITNPSSSQLLAQTQPGSDSSPTPRLETDDRSMPSQQTPTNQPALEAAPTPSETTTPETVPLPPEKTTTGNKPGPAGDTSMQPGSYWCMNNPNPQCRG